MKIEKLKVESLSLDPANARKHGAKNLEAIKGSLAKFGQRKPIVVRKGVVIAGNGTLLAAKALGMKEVLTVNADDLSPSDAAAFAIADNRTAELADWDIPSFSKSVSALKSEGFNFDAIGLFAKDIDDILGVEKKSGVEKTKLQLVVTFDDQAAQEDLFLELRDRGFKVKA